MKGPACTTNVKETSQKDLSAKKLYLQIYYQIGKYKTLKDT